MATALPQYARLRLQHTLAQWRHWRDLAPDAPQPQLVRPLSQGLSNHSVLVANDKGYVVRIDGAHTANLGLNRLSERRVLQQAAQANLAPTPRYSNPDLGALVCDYLPADADQYTELEALAELVRGIHRLPSIHQRLDLRERIHRYQRQAEQRGITLPGQVTEFAHLALAGLDSIERDGRAQVLCHNDLVAANRLRSGGRLYALDWEYAAMGHPWFDLAVIASEMPAQGCALLSAYLQRAATGQERQTFVAICRLYRYLELLWLYAVGQQPGVIAPALQRLRDDVQ
jgi:thiamine kinase-like enzyme